MGVAVWSDDCARPSLTPASPTWTVAHLDEMFVSNWRKVDVFVASCRCRRRGARLSCAIAPEQASRTAADAQAYSQVSHGPVDIRDRQTAFLRSGNGRAACGYRA